MKWKNKSFLVKLTFVSLLLTQVSMLLLTVWAPSYPNNVSVASGIQFKTQHSEREILHFCDSSIGWTNSTPLTMTFSTDTENKTQGTASVKVIIDFGVGATGAFRSNTGLSKDISDKDYVDWWIRTNDTISNYFFALYDSSGRNMYWNYPVSVQHDTFTLYQLPLANPTFEHASFDRSDISYIVFQCVGAGFISIWMDYISASVWQHTYIPQSTDSYRNITINNGVLGLSKESNAFNIEGGTEDRVTTELHAWFSSYITKFRPYSPVSTSMNFDLNSRAYGEPQAVSGVSSWSYDEESTTVSLTVTNNTMVTLRWETEGTKVLVWFLDRMMMWIGIGGFFLILLAPTMLVYYGKQGDWTNAFSYPLMLFVIGLALIIGWLWG